MDEVMWHHGTCNLCGIRNTLVLHFGYGQYRKRHYTICLKCLNNNAQMIMYGWMNYKVDRTIDLLSEKETVLNLIKKGEELKEESQVVRKELKKAFDL